MGQIVLVLVLAVAAGTAVYYLSLRLSEGEESRGSGFLPEEQTLRAGGISDLPPGYQYAILTPGRRSWQTRLLAFLGIVVVVAVAALLLALSVYEITHLVRVTLTGYLGTPSPSLSP